MSEDLVLVEPSDALRPARAQRAELALPQLIVDAGPVAVARFLEFFAARIARDADGDGLLPASDCEQVRVQQERSRYRFVVGLGNSGHAVTEIPSFVQLEESLEGLVDEDDVRFAAVLGPDRKRWCVQQRMWIVDKSPHWCFRAERGRLRWFTC